MSKRPTFSEVRGLVTQLQRLSRLATTSSTVAITDVTGLTAALEGRALASHEHLAEDITDLDDVLAGLTGPSKGVTTVTFGAFPGAVEASATVTGQTGILSTSVVQVVPRLVATADHSADEHRLEEIDWFAGNIVAGTGFTIYAHARGPRRVYGAWSVGWTWV